MRSSSSSRPRRLGMPVKGSTAARNSSSALRRRSRSSSSSARDHRVDAGDQLVGAGVAADVVAGAVGEAFGQAPAARIAREGDDGDAAGVGLIHDQSQQVADRPVTELVGYDHDIGGSALQLVDDGVDRVGLHDGEARHGQMEGDRLPALDLFIGEQHDRVREHNRIALTGRAPLRPEFRPTSFIGGPRTDFSGS